MERESVGSFLTLSSRVFHTILPLKDRDSCQNSVSKFMAVNIDFLSLDYKLRVYLDDSFHETPIQAME